MIGITSNGEKVTVSMKFYKQNIFCCEGARSNGIIFNDLELPITRFQGHCILTSRISQKWCILVTKLLKNTNRKPYTFYRMVPFSMTLSDLWPDFKVTTFFDIEYLRNDTR